MNGPPEKSRRWQGDGENGTFQPIDTLRSIGMQARPRCQDRWIEGYLEFIERLSCHSVANPLSTACVADAVRRYGMFCLTCRPDDRKRTWRAVHAACALFAQYPRRN